jgi:hypothetical protein
VDAKKCEGKPEACRFVRNEKRPTGRFHGVQ